MSVHFSSRAARRGLIASSSLTLAALLMGLAFVVHTTGGTLFLFATVAPVLVVAAIVILAAVALHEFRGQHKLFEIEYYDPGEAVFRQGDAGECAYFVRDGEVEVVKVAEGKETVVAKLGKGQYFGEMALLSNEPRNATVRTSAPTELATLGKTNFLALLSVLPSTQEDIMKTIRTRAMRMAGVPESEARRSRMSRLPAPPPAGAGESAPATPDVPGRRDGPPPEG